jgi:uncharacterized protein
MEIKELTPENLKETLYLYYSSEGSHGFNHLDEVYKLALEMNKKLNLELDEREIMIVSYCHDMFSVSNRENHEIGAESFIINKRNIWFLKDLDNDVIIRMAKAVAQHRASYTGEFHSKLAELLNAADRGYLGIEQNIIRSLKYNIERYPNKSVKLLIENVYNHGKDKFSSNGYMRFNDLYRLMFAEEIKIFQNYFDNVTLKEIRDICSDWLFGDKCNYSLIVAN